MKTTGCLLLALLFGFSVPAQPARPTTTRRLTVRNRSGLFDRLISDLSPTHASSLYGRYRAEARLQRTSRNHYVPAVTDSVLTVRNAADQLTLFKNKYKMLLLAGKFSSGKVSFAGFKPGVAQTEFCRKLHLSTGYTSYAVFDGQEQFLELIFTFASGHLKQVEYKMLQPLEALD